MAQANKRQIGDPKHYQFTRMCTFHLQGGCSRGSTCLFAHDEHDIRDKPDFYKTRLCEAFRRNRCARGANCHYAHGGDEMRCVAAERKKNRRVQARAQALEGARRPRVQAPTSSAEGQATSSTTLEELSGFSGNHSMTSSTRGQVDEDGPLPSPGPALSNRSSSVLGTAEEVRNAQLAVGHSPFQQLPLTGSGPAGSASSAVFLSSFGGIGPPMVANSLHPALGMYEPGSSEGTDEAPFPPVSTFQMTGLSPNQMVIPGGGRSVAAPPQSSVFWSEGPYSSSGVRPQVAPGNCLQTDPGAHATAEQAWRQPSRAASNGERQHTPETQVSGEVKFWL